MSIHSKSFTDRRLVERILIDSAVDAERHAEGQGGNGWPSTPWTLQGFGMLRLLLGEDKALRLHVWDDRYAFEGVTEMHTHPWDMTSLVVAGSVTNIRYGSRLGDTPTHYQQKILCGEGGGACDAPKLVALAALEPEVINAGQEYTQTWHEIHSSHPKRGTVTLVHRDMQEDADHAFVYYEVGKEWVTAEPRQATAEEVFNILDNALRTWF